MSSVLVGQFKISFVEAFDALEQAKADYTEAEPTHSQLLPRNKYDHLPVSKIFNNF